MKVVCAKEIEFCCAHRVYKHEGKCRYLHGHNYKLRVYAKGKKSIVDTVGRVIDFTEIKKEVKGWIDENWDHNAIISCEDIKLQEALALLDQDRKPYILPFNSTAENMAIYLLNDIFPKLFKEKEILIFKVELYESSNNMASAEL